MKLQEELLAYLRQVAIFKGSQTKHLLQLQFVLSKCTVQRGHVLLMESQPCAGMFFIQSGQVNVLTKVAKSHAAEATLDEEEFTVEGDDSTADFGSPHAKKGRSKDMSGQLPGVIGKFHSVAILGPTDYIGEVVASKHPFSAVAETACSLLWLKPQELHMLGHKALGLAMQYNALRQARWQQSQHMAQTKPASLTEPMVAEPTPVTARQALCLELAKLCCRLLYTQLTYKGVSRLECCWCETSGLNSA